MNNEIFIDLGAAFPFDEVSAKLQVTLTDKMIGMAVFYLDSRIIQKRLDNVIGHQNWKNQYVAWQDVEVRDPKGNVKTQKSQLCGIAIYNEARNEWVGKFDGAECSDIEPVKGGLTDSFKRAACMWGIGRYLYEMDGIWVDIKQQGKSYAIKDDQWSKLRKAYDDAVKKIFGTVGGQQVQNSGSNANNAKTATGTQQQQPTNNQQNQQPQTAPPVQNGANEKQPPAVAPTAQAKASVQQPDAPQQQAPQKPQTNATQENVYKIQSIKPAGGDSHLLELLNNTGKITSAYTQAIGKGVTVGSYLRNVELEQKKASFGSYHLITKYELAA